MFFSPCLSRRSQRRNSFQLILLLLALGFAAQSAHAEAPPHPCEGADICTGISPRSVYAWFFSSLYGPWWSGFSYYGNGVGGPGDPGQLSGEHCEQAPDSGGKPACEKEVINYTAPDRTGKIPEPDHVQKSIGAKSDPFPKKKGNVPVQERQSQTRTQDKTLDKLNKDYGCLSRVNNSAIYWGGSREYLTNMIQNDRIAPVSADDPNCGSSNGRSVAAYTVIDGLKTDRIGLCPRFFADTSITGDGERMMFLMHELTHADRRTPNDNSWDVATYNADAREIAAACGLRLPASYYQQ